MRGPVNAREFRLTFGKYKGETLEEVYVEDREYLDWLLDANASEKPGSRGYVLCERIHQCCDEMRNVRIYK